jgi:iron complex transport system ATP-binding protein
MLQINQISVELSNNMIIENLSFSLDNGILAVLGLNGSGKTTLLRSVAGLLTLKNGSIKINNQQISELSRNQISKLISFVPQEYSSIFNYTVEEMILFGRTPHIKAFGLPSPKDHKIVHDIMHEINISHLKMRHFNELSGGERRLVLISMALAQDTDLVLFDEPTTFLDIKNSMLIIERIRRMTTEMRKILLVTMHDINQTIVFADKILMLCSLKRYKFGTVGEMINEQNLFELYNTHFDIEKREKSKFYVIPKMN